jgi:hypothetical protein
MDSRRPWPPSVRAILWMDAVLLVGVALALAGKPPALGHATGVWTWLALGGSVLTAVFAAVAAFHLSALPQQQIWTMLPVPAMVLWAAATLLGYLTLPADAQPWGDALAAAGECLGFLLAVGLPILALIVFMLWLAAPAAPRQVLAMGALASAGAAASLLTLVHPHDSAFADLCAHGTAFAVMLGIGAAISGMKGGKLDG